MDLVNLLNKPSEAHAGPDVPNKTPSLTCGSKSPSPENGLKSRHNSESAPSQQQENVPPASLSSSMPPLGPARSMPSKVVSRGRQPWSAGGYSLPLLPEGKEEVQVAPLSSRPGLYRDPSYEQSSHEHGYSMSNSSDTFYRHHHMNSSSKLSSSSLVTPREFEFSFNDAASKMRHNMSDSRSSMSSYVSSSFSHSRLSSASTVGHLASLTEDQLYLEKPLPGQSQLLPRVSELERRPAQYRTESLPSIPVFSAGSYNYSHSKSRRTSDVESPSSGMPPEAIRHISSTSVTYPPPTPMNATPIHRHSQSQRLHEHHGFGHAHKRSSSAPDIPKDLITSGSLPALSHQGPAPALGPPPMPLTPTARPLPSGEYTGLSSLEFYPSFAVDSMYEAKARCMYVDDCKTGSTLRKAISHIFGRNKLCTRLVPDSVWVHFCRKHYQRSRYRSAGDYSKLQIVLVQTQIQRVQRWSDDNFAAGRPGELTHWSLCIRKREAKRLEKAAGRKGGASLPSSDDEADESGDGTPKGTEVPQWLISHCGNKYDSATILDIITRLQNDMESGKITQFPDIEILPSISYDGPAGQKRKPMTATALMEMAPPHRRTQSMSFGSVLPMDGMPPPRYEYYGREDLVHAREKRQRISDVSGQNVARFLPGMRGPGPMAAPEHSYHGHPHGRSQSDISQLHQQMQHSSMSRQRLPSTPSHQYGGSPTAESPRRPAPFPSPYPQTLPPLVNNGPRPNRIPRLPLPSTPTESHPAHMRHASSPLGAMASNPMVAAPRPVRPFAPSAIATLEEERRPYEAEVPPFTGNPVQAVPVNAP